MHIICLSAVLLFLGCSGTDGRRERLDAIEELMESEPYPRQALEELSRLDSGAMANVGDRMMYELLRLELKLKNDLPVSDIGCFDTVISYFGDIGDRRHMADAYQYKGMALFRMADYQGAMRSYTAALDIAEGLDDTLRMARARDWIGEVYYECFNRVPSIDEQRLVAELYRNTDKELNYHYSLVELAIELAYAGQPEESLRLLDSIAFVRDHGLEALDALYRLAHATPLLYAGRTAEAKEILKEAAGSEYAGAFSLNELRNLVNIYIAENKLDSARIWLERGAANKGFRDHHVYYRALGDIDRAAGDYESAMRNLSVYYAGCDSAYAAALRNNVQQARTDYFAQTAESARLKVWHQRSLVILLLGLGAAGVVLLLYMAVRCRARRMEMVNKLLVISELSHRLQHHESVNADMAERLREDKSRVESLTRTLSDRTAQYERLRRLADELWAASFAPINSLCDDYFNNRGSKNTKALLYTSVEAEIEKLKSKESVGAFIKKIDDYSDELLSRAFDYFAPMRTYDRYFMALLVGGISTRAACVLADMSMANYYAKRKRVISRIAESDFDGRDDLLEYIERNSTGV